MLGILLGLGTFCIAGAKAAYDNYGMRKITSHYDEKGNLHYSDRLCRDYINGERVQHIETKDPNGVTLYSTIGTTSSKIYDTSYGRGTQQLFAMSEENKQRAIESGRLAYMQYNPYFEKQVTTEIATGRTITCLFKCEYRDKPIYKKWYFRPECQGKLNYNETVKGDYGIDITKEEYYKLSTILSSYATLPSDQKVLYKLWGRED